MSDQDVHGPYEENSRRRSRGSQHDDPFFYWQLPSGEQARLRAADLIRFEEGCLAHDINWGRLLLDARADPETEPDLNASWSGPVTPEHISDLVSAVLQVAVELGHDPEVICDRALFTHRAVRRQAAEAVRRW